jgi:hypothetical protein
MFSKLSKLALFAAASAGFAFAGVSVSSPASGATVASPAHFVASATPASSAPITSMMIYVDNKAVYTVYQNHLDTTVTLGTGSHKADIKAWDSKGALYTSSVTFTAGSGTTTTSSNSSSSSGGGNTISNIDEKPSWDSCSACAGAGANGPVAQYSMTQSQSSPAMDGKATKFWIGGSTPYSDVIWVKTLSNPGNATHFTYDAYFYMTDPNSSEALEFDFNLTSNGHYYVFGNQCSPKWSHTWDTWDMNAGKWVSTGIACPVFTAYSWNHVTIEVEKTSGNQLHWLAITYNGNKHYIDRYVNSQGTSWTNGMSIDFQMDGDYAQHQYSVWLDKVSLSYY